MVNANLQDMLDNPEQADPLKSIDFTSNKDKRQLPFRRMLTPFQDRFSSISPEHVDHL